MSFSELAPISNRLSLTSMLRSERRVADVLELAFDLAAGGLGTAGGLELRAQRRQLRQLGRVHAIDVVLFEQVALDLAAGGFRDALHRHHVRHFEAGVFVDEPRDLRRDGQELLHVHAMQHEHDEVVGAAVFGAHAGGHHLAELQAFGANRDALDVVRVVVLAVDEDDLLRAAGDVQLAGLHHSEIAGAQPAIP